jgi:hypothetical protein
MATQDERCAVTGAAEDESPADITGTDIPALTIDPMNP